MHKRPFLILFICVVYFDVFYHYKVGQLPYSVFWINRLL